MCRRLPLGLGIRGVLLHSSSAARLSVSGREPLKRYNNESNYPTVHFTTSHPLAYPTLTSKRKLESSKFETTLRVGTAVMILEKNRDFARLKVRPHAAFEAYLA